MSSEYDNVFSQSLTAGSDFDNSVFAQNDSDLMDIVNKSGIYSSKFDCPECHDNGDKPIIDSSQKPSAYANDDDMIDKKFNEACASLLEDLIADDDDLADALNKSEDDDLFDDDDSDYDDYDDDTDDEPTAVDDTDKSDAPIPVDPASVAPADEAFEYDQNKYAAFVEWAIVNKVPMNKQLLEAAKAKFAIHEEDESAAKDDAATEAEVKKEIDKPDKTDKEIAEDTPEDEIDDKIIDDVDDNDKEASDALAKDLNEDEDDEILSMILDV